MSFKKAIILLFKKRFVRFKTTPEFFTFKKTNNAIVSIIIPVYNQYNFTRLCLWSILQNTKDLSYEIIIADDNSNDETEYIQKKIGNLTIIRNSQNLGFLRNCNNAAKHANGKYLLFLNNDTQVQPMWLSSLVELIESDENIGMVGSKLVFPNSTIQEAGAYISREGQSYRHGQNKNPFLNQFNNIKEVDYISGASILLSRELWKELDGFDEIYDKAYYEDVDLAFKVRELKGLRVMYQPGSEVIHFEGTSHNEKALLYSNINKDKFVEKWATVLNEKHLIFDKLLQKYK
ncbi:MAG: glycosyltransferase family 2 protein [bacterium]